MNSAGIFSMGVLIMFDNQCALATRCMAHSALSIVEGLTCVRVPGIISIARLCFGYHIDILVMCSTAGEIGVQDFVKSIKGVEAHADKVAQAIIGVPTLLQTRSSRLKKLGIPCKQVSVGLESF
jgi:hypothetical protein